MTFWGGERRSERSGGVVIVYNKQQAYLLEDLQEMVRRVQAAGRPSTANNTTENAGGTAARGTRRKRDRTTANLGEITVLDMEELMAPEDLFNDSAGDFLGLMGPLSFTHSGDSAARQETRRTAMQLDGELFVMPSVDTDTLSEQTRSTSDAHQEQIKIKSRSRSVSFATGEQLEQQHEPIMQEDEVYGGLGPNADWNPDEEMFEVGNFDLLEGLEMPGLSAALEAATPNAAQPSSNLSPPNSADLEANAVEMQHAEADQLPFAGADEQDAGADGAAVQADAAAVQTEVDKHAGQGAKAAARKSRRRRPEQPLVDDPDQLQIENRVYRTWFKDTSPLVNNRLKNKAAAVVSTSSFEPATFLDKAQLPLSVELLPIGLNVPSPVGGVPLCPELLEMYQAPAELLAARGRDNRRGPHDSEHKTPDSPLANNSIGEGDVPHMQSVHRQPLPLEQVPGATARHDGAELGFEDLAPEHHEQELLSNDEAHDKLMDLPFADIEVERMRAAGTPNSGSLHLSSPGTAARMLQSVGRPAGSSTSNDSMMLRPMQLDELEVQSGAAAALKSALRSSRQPTGDLDEQDMYFGAGNLADLLPEVGMVEEADAEMAHDIETMRFGSERLNSSQLPLPETDPSQPTQGRPQLDQPGVLTNANKMVLSIFNERLQRVVEQQEQGGVVSGPPSISLFSLLREGHLSRTEAAKLFYQVCVTSSAGYIKASQERPFDDIMISAGANQ
eukprot:gene13534-13660_t